jgi:uridine kinase
MNSSADHAIDGIADAQRRVGRERATLIAISGIDASGKGHLARKLAQGLRERAYRVALVGVDGWLRLPQERFNAVDTARHFYSRAIRFQHLILPLRERRSIEVRLILQRRQPAPTVKRGIALWMWMSFFSRGFFF